MQSLQQLPITACPFDLQNLNPNPREENQSHPWFDKQCGLSRSDMRRAKQNFERNPYDREGRSKYLIKCCKYRKLVRHKQKEYKNKLLKQLLSLEENNPKAFWRTLDKLKNLDSPKSNIDDTIKASEWLNHFKNLGNCGTDYELTADEKRELELLESQVSNDNCWTNTPIKVSEVKKAVKSLKNNKTPGDDFILNEMLKAATDILAPAITKVFNHVFTSGNYPVEWNTGYQVPIHKKGDTSNCNNYRGITITSCLGKLFNKVLNTRLVDHLEETGTLSDNQAAYRKGYSTTDHIFSLKSIINKYVRMNKARLYCCFVDFQKAFDSVPREALLLKLLRLNINGKLYKIIKHMYSSGSSRVKLPVGITTPFTTTTGIKQGDSLSPMLFNLYLEDLITDLHNIHGQPASIESF